VNELLNYIISFKGLSSGSHSFHFHITDKFFESMQSVEIHPTDVKVNLELNYMPGIMTLIFEGSGFIDYPCDICVEVYRQPVNYQRKVVVKIGEGESDDDDIIFISVNESQIDVSQIIYDDILLSLPLQIAHPILADGSRSCNPKQLELLDRFADQKPIDHRWDALKNLKLED
jgi:uncharacterized metal-binding protein YceD (DUF177 family)